MKIGFSLGRCVRDIVNGEVSIDDVAFLIAATNIKDPEQLDNVIDHYMFEPGYLLGLDFEKCKEVARGLWSTNRIIQPRAQGMHRHAQPENSIWVDIFPTELSNNESVKKAWDAYRFMIHMVENVDAEAMEVFKT
jgi:hypothetical protein